MAESHPPPNARSPPRPACTLPTANPMQSDRIYNVTQLISPPPEETLRRSSRQMPFTPSLLADTPPGASKRKRRTQSSAPLQPELTPNPKARKQAKHVPSDLESPTPPNFRGSSINESPSKSKRVTLPDPSRVEVEYLTLTDANSGFKAKRTRTRRSVTPIPPYEPPSDIFTSPREVMASPLSKSSISMPKSRSKSHTKPASIKIIPVKKELPDIDLNTPMPPPSPTDDPILLSGPFGHLMSSLVRQDSQTTFRRAEASTTTEAIQTEDIPTTGRNPLESASDSEGLAYHDWRIDAQPETLNSSDFTMGLRSSDADVVPVDLAVFNLNDLPPSSDVWSDSDDDILDAGDTVNDAGEDGEGEYTGKWRTLLVKTKQDPPSSVTRNRMEQWGRPISPFPEEAKSLQSFDEEEEKQVNDTLGMDQYFNQDRQDEVEEEEVRRISVEPEEEGHASHAVEMDEQPTLSKSTGSGTILDRQLELNDSDIHNTTADVDVMGDVLLEGDDGEESDDGETEMSFVKITSADPLAAARAAAILKQYDYDCFTEIAKSKRRQSAPGRISRRSTNIAEALARKGMSEGRITKDKNKKRSSIGTGVIGGQVFISGTPLATLRNLLEEAEAEVSSGGTPRPLTSYSYETPIRHRSSLGILDPLIIGTSLNHNGEKPWTKNNWRLLDACFTDERLLVGTRLHADGDGLADVDTISLNNVVDRYVGIFGGEHSIKKFGLDWERDAILLRTKALRKKQRSGNIAPPMTPLSMRSGTCDTPDIDIPDFTPLKGYKGIQQLTRPTLLPPIMGDTLFQNLREEGTEPWKIPTIHAPHYKKLMAEAVAIGNKSIEDAGQPLPTETLVSPGITVHGKGHSHVEDDHNPPQLETPRTLGARVKGFLFSYLPSLSKTAPHPSRKIKDALQHSRLPLPPPDLFDKPRAPITTPTRPPVPKPKHPKELVKLHPAPLPVPKSSMIPRLKPQRLINLNPVPPPEPRISVLIIKPRSSNGSVKDLVKSFEDMERVGGNERAIPKEPRPVWRP